MNDPFEFESDLDLMAFCYLTDELLQVDRQAFERRLATEQPAREALARAVELLAALQQASSVELNHAVAPHVHTSPAAVAPRAFAHGVRIVAYLSIASAACLAVVIGIRTIPRANPLQSAETALVWSQVRDAWSDTSVVSEGDAALATESDVEPLAEETMEEELNSDMPAWLMTAVDGPGEDEVPSTE